MFSISHLSIVPCILFWQWWSVCLISDGAIWWSAIIMLQLTPQTNRLKSSSWGWPKSSISGWIQNPSLVLTHCVAWWYKSICPDTRPIHSSLHPHNWHKVNIKSKYAQIFPLFVEITEFLTTLAYSIVHFWLVGFLIIWIFQMIQVEGICFRNWEVIQESKFN